MSQYTFISSRDPIDGDQSVHGIARDLAGAGHEVAMILVENGTFLARGSACAKLRKSLTDAGVTLFADELSLAERGIVDAALAADVKASSLELVIDHLAAGRKVSWH